MSTSTLGLFLRHLALSEEVSRLGIVGDHHLLAAYESGSGQAAFTELMRRHGPMVLRTCCRILGRGPDAEDAFQATFVLLARKAGSISKREALGGWLHRVAYRTAVDVLIQSGRRKAHERQAGAMTHAEPDPLTKATWNELRPILDAELDALPEQARKLLIACYLQEKTHAEAAAELGLPQGSIAWHLERARTLLAKQLSGRGITVSALLLAVLLEDSAKGAGVPAVLLVHTVEAARTFTEQAAGIVSNNVTRLVKGGFAKMTKGWTHLSMALAGWLGLLGAGLVACQTLKAWPDQKPEQEPPATVAERPAQQRDKQTRTDCFGDPLPPGALARLGTARFFSYYTATAYPSQIFAFSPDGKLLASVTDRKIVVLWDAATGKEMRRLTIGDTAESRENLVVVNALDFAPDGKTLVTVTCDQRACFWEVDTGKLLRTVVYQGPKREHARSAKGRIAFLPDGRILAVADFPKDVEVTRLDSNKIIWECHVWDVATGKEVRQLRDSMKGRHLFAKAFSPDGKLLATTRCGEPSISLWDVATGKEIHCLSLGRPNDTAVLFQTLAFSHDGKTLAVADDKMVSVWDVATGKFLRQLEAPAHAHGAALAFSPDGKALVGGRNGRLWNVRTGAEVLWLGLENVTGALFSPDGKVLAVTEEEGRIRLLEVATGKEILPRAGHRDGIRAMAYSPDSKTLASTSHDGTIRLWEIATGKEIRQLVKRNRTWGYCSVAYSPDGKMLVSIDNKVIHLWDIATVNKEIRHFREIRQPFNNWDDVESPCSATLSPDGKILAAALGDHMACLWQVATGEKIYEGLAENQCAGESWSVAFSPDSRILAVPNEARGADFLEVATGKSIGRLRSYPSNERVHSLAFSPDGKILAVSSCLGGGTISLWEVASGKGIYQRDVVDGGEVWYLLAFSPDGRMLATVGRTLNNDRESRLKREVRLWDVVSGKEIGRLRGHQAPIRTIVFSPDGKTLASSSDDLTCLIWDVAAVAGRLKPGAAGSPPPKPLSKQQLEAVWADLANIDPGKAYRAVSALRAAPDQAVLLLKERVQPAAPVTDPKQLACWIADLDDERFAVREKAQRAILSLGEPAIPALRRALADQPSLEMKRRLQNILAAVEPKFGAGPPMQLRQIRAVQVLEFIATPEAQQVLQTLAKGAAGVSLTREAQAALERLARRRASRP